MSKKEPDFYDNPIAGQWATNNPTRQLVDSNMSFEYIVSSNEPSLRNNADFNSFDHKCTEDINNSNSDNGSCCTTKTNGDSSDSDMSFEYLDDEKEDNTDIVGNKVVVDINRYNTHHKYPSPEKNPIYNLQSSSSYQESETSTTNEDSNNDSYVSSDMSYSSITTHSSYSSYDSDKWSLDSLSSISTVDNEENDENGGKNKDSSQISSQSIISEDDSQLRFVIDTIGTYNINKQYSHECSAELMLKANLSLLAIQEPFASFTTNNKAWNAYRVSNLNSAYFKAFESKHQVLIIDEEKWGGRNLEPIQCFQEGRILALPFKLSDTQMLGIISIYAITSGDEVLADGSHKTKIRINTAKKAREIYDIWIKKYPGIIISIIGDLQETWSKTNLDNLGKYRKDIDENGVLNEFMDSHYSVVRQSREESQQHYWTRQGRLGARGIDHILIPNSANNTVWEFNGYMESDLGKLFYNSDHCLLTSSFIRYTPNETILCSNRKHFRYDEIYNIPLRCSGAFEQNSEFDKSKFKCEKLDAQEILYNKIQKLTSPESQFSKEHKPKIDKLITNFIHRIWNKSVKLGKDGRNNNILKMNEKDADFIEEISVQFKSSIINMMQSLELDSEVNNTRSIQTNRNNIKKSGCTKPFNTLPITSKLRLSIKIVNRTIQRLKNIQQDITLENNIRYTIDNTIPPPNVPPILNTNARINDTNFHSEKDNNNSNLSRESIKPGKKSKKKKNIDSIPNIERKIINLINSKTIENKIQRITNEMDLEYEGWIKHTEAIKHVRDKGDLATDKTYGHTLHTKGGDFLMYADPEDIDKLNDFMKDSNYKQLFMRCSEDGGNPCDPKSIVKYSRSWKDSLKQCKNWAGRINTADESQLAQMPIAITEALINLRKLRRHLSWKQRVYKHDKLNYFCEVNNMSALTSTLKPKVREAPAVHDIIFDTNSKKYRQCINVKEQLQATKEYHDKWMKPSKAKKSCFFAELITEGSLGIRGIKNFPDKIFKRKDIKDVIFPHETLSEEIIQRIIKAHGPHTAEEFRPPNQHNKEFNYPFYFINNKGDLNNKFIEQDFWKAIHCIPTKARHDNYYIAVVGRMHKSWAESLLLLAKLIMVTRIIPKNINILSRIPIPKPEKPNEYRPLSVCDDLFCFVNGIFNKQAAAATERAKYLHDAVTAYRKGKGCSSLVSIELAAREDCVESGQICALIMEDIEKFFDRLTTEVILNAMIKAGFPDLGYVEFKGSSMSFKKVLIQTIKGTILSSFECGLEQGNPDSPRAANLVIMNIHNMWKKATNHNTNYKFAITDAEDGPVEVGEAGYSDDNLVLVWDKNTRELIAIIQKKLDMTGDFSIVCKLGRKGSKCIIYLFNIPAEEAKKIIKFFSIAWSFAEDKPMREEIKIIIYLKEEDAAKLNIDMNIDGPVQVTYGPEGEIIVETMDNFTDLKHLGLTMNTQGDTACSAKNIIKNIKAKIASLNIKNLKDNPQRHSCNMLLNSLHSYATLPSNLNIQELRNCDKLLIQNLRRKKGLSKHDTTIHFFIPENKFGFGIKSFVDTYILAISREMEVVLNANGLDSEGTRGRLTAHLSLFDIQKKKSPTFNHVSDAVVKLGHFGLFLRDFKDGIINYLIEEVRIWTNKTPIGTDKFCSNKEPYLGEKHPELIDFIYGGKIHRFIKDYVIYKKEGRIKDFRKLTKSKKSKNTITFLNTIWDKASIQMSKDCYSMFHFQEWIFSPGDINPIISSKWTNIRHSTKEPLENIRPESFNNIWLKMKEKITISPSAYTSWEKGKITPIGTHGSVLLKILHSKSPLIIATDGGLSKSTENNNTWASASITWCLLKILPNESISSGEWQNRETIPLLQRTCILPRQLGSTSIDIGHAELLAFCMQEECLPSDIPRIVVMDSDSVRKRMLEIRDNKAESDRYEIRKLYGGLGKTLMSRASYHVNKWKDKSPTQDDLTSLNIPQIYPNDTSKTNSIIFKSLFRRNSEFISIMKDAVSNPQSSWKPHYNDNNIMRTIIEVDSHQLNKAGNNIKNVNKRFDSLSPNLALLNANHWADEGASLAIRKCKENKDHQNNIYNLPDNLQFPHNNLRFHVTYNGKMIDKNQSDFIENLLTKERIDRLQQREFQGLIARLAPHTTLTPRDMARTSSHRRYLTNLTSTHSRACYKCKQYLALNIMEEEQCKKGNANERFYELLLTKNLLKKHPHILACPECRETNSKDSITIKRGNRRHYTHFCPNGKVAKFRNDTNNWIEELLKRIWINIADITGKDQAYLLLNKINQLLLSDNMKETGKLSLLIQENTTTHHLAGINNGNYVSIEEWYKLLQIESIEEGIEKNIPILQHILGFRTALSDGSLEERNMGLSDVLGIGIIPLSLQKVVQNFFENNSQLIQDREIAQAYKSRTWSLWRRVQAVMKGRGIGIHRITHTIIRDRERLLRDKFDIPGKRTCNKNLEEQKSILVKEEKDNSNNKYSKNCLGPTCSGAAITPNKIKITYKICMRCMNYHTAKRRCDTILHEIKKADPSTCKKIASIIVSDENVNKITSPLMGILIDCLGEIQPWLTKSNRVPYKNRGLRPGVRKPLQMIIHALRSSSINMEKIKCASCKEETIVTINSCAGCNLLSSIHHHFKFNNTQAQTPTTKNYPPVPNDNNTNQKDLLEKLTSPIISPLIKANICNELKTLRSPKKRKNVTPKNNKSPTHIEDHASKNNEHKQPSSTNTPTNYSDGNTYTDETSRLVLHSMQKLNSNKKKKNTTAYTSKVSTARNLLHELNTNETKNDSSNKQNNTGLRLQNQMLRSAAMNSILSKINLRSNSNFHIANSNLLSYLDTQEFTRTKNIPESINFTLQKARDRHLGTYLFPLFIGSYHQGNWITICVKKMKADKSTNIFGWLFDPTNKFNKKNKIPEMITLEAKYCFNRSISWEFPSCLPLKERECGPRCVTTCLILALAVQFNIPWQTAITEACNLSIAEEKLTPHLCREITFKIDTKISEVWDTKLVFPMCNKTNNKKTTSIDITNIATSRLLNNYSDTATIETKVSNNNNNRKSRKRRKRTFDKLRFRIDKHSKRKKESANQMTMSSGLQNHINDKSRGKQEKNIVFNKPKALGRKDINSTNILRTPKNIASPNIFSTPSARTIPTIQKKEYNNERKITKSIHIHTISNLSHEYNSLISNGKSIENKQPPATKINKSWDYTAVFQILQETNDVDSIISHIGNNTITKRNIQTLKPETWLNDEVINTFLALAQQQYNSSTSSTHGNPVHCFNSFFFTKLLQNDAYSYKNVDRFSRRIHNNDIFCLDKLIIPININGNHWTVICINFHQKSILYLDSLGDHGTLYTNSCLRYLQDEHMHRHHYPLADITGWSIQSNREGTPKQNNNYDCGVFVCLFALHLIRNEPITFTQSDINRGIRPWIAKAILQKCIPNTREGYCDTSS